jgi:drug/metabolite transporter (DMT)-like permease
MDARSRGAASATSKRTRLGATSKPAPLTHANRAGIVAMIIAMGCFLVNDTLVKIASERVPTTELIFVRGAFAFALVLTVAAATGALGHVREIARGWVAARAIFDALATMFFLVSLFHLPINSATAINMTSPLIITALAAVFLGERAGASVWIATLAGFAGVLLVVQPRTAGLDAYALVCLLATVLLSVRDLMTRRVHRGVPSILISLSNTVIVTLLAAALSPLEEWRPIGALEVGMLAVAAVFLSAAYFLIVVGTRRGELSVVAPFRYAGLLFAAIAGYAVWGDVPNTMAWLGMLLLVGSGVYVLRASRRASAADPARD